MSVERVKAWLKQWDKDGEVREFAESSATVELAARAVGVIPARIAKTLSFQDGKEGCILVVTAGDGRINSGKFKAAFGLKSKMLSPEAALALTGYAVGGVCPFGHEDPKVAVYLDISLQRFSTVFPACGSGNSAVELTCDELFACSRANAWVDVCAGWE